MKKQPALILSAVSCVLTGVCLFELHSVKQELQQVRSLNSQHYSSLQMCIDGISGTVSDKLEQQQNLLAPVEQYRLAYASGTEVPKGSLFSASI